jgi:hypothetical protein
VTTGKGFSWLADLAKFARYVRENPMAFGQLPEPLKSDLAKFARYVREHPAFEPLRKMAGARGPQFDHLRQFSEAMRDAQLEAAAEAETLEHDKPDTASPGAATLKPATEKMIRAEIMDVYDDARNHGTKPPNINELPTLVRSALATKGYAASGAQIKAIGEEDEFKKRRGAVGAHWPPPPP